MRIIHTTKITFEPVSSPEELNQLLRQGHTDFYVAYGYQIERGKTNSHHVKADGMELDTHQNAWRAVRKGSRLSSFYLGDYNVEVGGYSDNFVFTSKLEAEMYMQYVVDGGERLPRQRQKTQEDYHAKQNIRLTYYAEV